MVNHHRDVAYRLLEPVPDLSLPSPSGRGPGGEGTGNADTSGNLIVQGDNLLALKALLPRYAGKVKCIYIDPPYNTGNEGWAYNDNVNSPRLRTDDPALSRGGIPGGIDLPETGQPGNCVVARKAEQGKLDVTARPGHLQVRPVVIELADKPDLRGVQKSARDKLKWNAKAHELTINAPLDEDEAEALVAKVEHEPSRHALAAAIRQSRASVEVFQTPPDAARPAVGIAGVGAGITRRVATRETGAWFAVQSGPAGTLCGKGTLAVDFRHPTRAWRPANVPS